VFPEKDGPKWEEIMTRVFDTQYLAALIKTKRGNRGLREVAQEIGDVSPSTLSRIENGKVPDIDTFLRICAWLQVSSEEFIKETDDQQQNEISTTDRIEGYLRADRELTPEMADALAKLMKSAYRAATEGKLGPE
jgi:transcriptional regulator with XRE-family HTH domain